MNFHLKNVNKNEDWKKLAMHLKKILEPMSFAPPIHSGLCVVKRENHLH